MKSKTYNLGEIMRTDLVRVNEHETILMVLKLMETCSVGSVLVVRENKEVGLITNTDLVKKILLTGKDPAKTTAKEVMNTPIASLDGAADVYDAYLFMNNYDCNHIPVAEKGKIVGIVTSTDLIKIEPSVQEKLQTEVLQNVHNTQ